MSQLGKKLSDAEVADMRQEKVELNRASRRLTGMKVVCKGKSDGLLECETSEGKCPEYDDCHASTKKK